MMLTRTGKLIDPVDLDMRKVTVDDVGWALANTMRWGGHCNKPFSVAQHTLACAAFVQHDPGAPAACMGDVVTPMHVLAALHHDDGEAFFGDMPRQIKHRPEMSWYRRAEHNATVRIANDLCGFVVSGFFGSIKPVDGMSLNTEVDLFFPPTNDVLSWFGPDHEALHLPKLPAKYIEGVLHLSPHEAAHRWIETHRTWAELVVGATPRRD